MAIYRKNALKEHLITEDDYELTSNDKMLILENLTSEDLNRLKFHINWEIKEKVLFHGIYRCNECDTEVALSKNYDNDNPHTFPPHPSHCAGIIDKNQKKNVWKLLIYSEGRT